MWAIDIASDPELLDRLRPHARHPETFTVVWVGEGWRDLVSECHEQLVREFPDYELLNVKLEYGELAYQALPRRWSSTENRWSDDEQSRLHAITDAFRARSARICEWCGGDGRLRDDRTLELTLCDECDARFTDPPG